jgi:hypothetical protein
MPEEQLEERRMKLRRGLTHMQRLFLYGKLSGLNDKDAALAAGYSLSVAENTRQKIWKPSLVDEFSQVKSRLSPPIPSRASTNESAVPAPTCPITAFGDANSTSVATRRTVRSKTVVFGQPSLCPESLQHVARQTHINTPRGVAVFWTLKCREISWC